MMNRKIQYAEAILEATDLLLAEDPSVYVMGLGVPDPKGVFHTTIGLQEKYGDKRVMDMPVSENAMTGIAIGSSLLGSRPIMVYQRVDFFLLALDQLINNGSKWGAMFGCKVSVPIVIRLIIGKGWGQGAQHSQSFFSLFAHIPGIKVVSPSNAYDAKGLLISSVKENTPVIFLEHRWLHNTTSYVPESTYQVLLGKAKRICEGKDLTIVTFSYMVLEVLKAKTILEKEGIQIEIIDLRSVKPIDTETILESIQKTRRLLVVEPDWKSCGIASEIITLVVEQIENLKACPQRITYPDQHLPTSWTLANHYYPTSETIAIQAMKMLEKKFSFHRIETVLQEKMKKPLDTPDKEFTGPF